jgi:hypothetical protein
LADARFDTSVVLRAEKLQNELQPTDAGNIEAIAGGRLLV